ncbi:MAG: Tyrosine--tRNA ligase [Candidatus Levybacteria bacterium]|nr:Tyrosine--tRNA ligase [Candidatus Levybacteria bacterium]
MDKIEELLTRGVANIIPNKEELKKVLVSGKKLNVYLGIDPTSTKIHLGHAVVLKKLNEFAKLGHSVTFLIGDFTALIGDTSDKDKERPVLTPDEIQENFKTYKKQAEKILDFSKIKVRYNSEWLDKLSSRELIKLVQQFSFGDFSSRELIKKRLGEGKRVGMHESLYPALQGYDSYFLDADLQIGGTDQTFNMQAGRTLQKIWRNKESFVLATEFLMGTDGRKMSKSWGNAIWLDDNPNDMYIKIMAISDEYILNYFLLTTNLSIKEIKKYEKRLQSKENPRDIKDALARQIVSELHGNELAKKVKLGGSIDIVFSTPDRRIFDILFEKGLVASRSEWKRLVEQKGVSVDHNIVKDPNATIGNGKHIEVGPRKILKISTQ